MPLLYVYSKGILQNFDGSKSFAKVPHPGVKFDRKHDKDDSEPVRPAVPELCPNFVQKWGPELPKFWVT